MRCQSLHDWVSQEDASGYEWSECAQCGAVGNSEVDDSEDRSYDYES